MSERGVYAIARGLFEHERFAPEPFTEREAWIWMIGEAAFRPHCKRVSTINVELQRGQFAHSLRFMAEKWKWPEPRVRRFLSRLRDGDALIDAASDAGVTVITLRKYDVYQPLLYDPDAPVDAPNDAKKNLLLEKKEEVRGGGSARATPWTQAALDFSLELAVIAGHDREFIPPSWFKYTPAHRVQMMLDQGWQIEIMRDAAKNAMRGKHDGPPSNIRYFEKIFARAHAPQLPLPTTEVSHAQTNRPDRPNLHVVRPSGGFAAFARARAKSAG